MEDRGGAGGADSEQDQRPQDQQPQGWQPQGQHQQGQQQQGQHQQGQPPQDIPQMQPQLVQPMFMPYLPPPPKRSKAPLVFTGVGGLVLGLLIGYGAGQGSKTGTASTAVVTTTTAPSSAAAASTPAAPASAKSSALTSAAPAAPAKIGGTISLAGMRGDEKLAVTLVKIADPAKSAEEFSGPSDGKRWVAVQIRITDTGTTAYSDSPANGAKLVDTQGQRYSETFGDTTLGQAMDSDVKLAPGDSALGVILFEVPAGQKLATFQFALDSGFADQTGQWQLS